MSQTILFLEALPTIAGGQQVLLDFVPALHNYKLHALLPGPGPLSDALAAYGVTCHFTYMSEYTLVRKRGTDLIRFPVDQLRLTLYCVRLIRRLRPDLIYANSSRTFVWGTLAAALTGRPIMWHVHNLLTDTKTLAVLRRMGGGAAVKRIIAVSKVAAGQFPELAYKTVIIPPGVNTSHFRPDPALREEVRQELGVALADKMIGIIGDLFPLKQQHILLEAAQSGAAGLRCLVVGDVRPGDDESRDYAAYLHQIAGDNVIFTGRRTDISALLNALDLLVIASERETGPLVLLEALACGVPVLSTPVGRAPELLSPENLFAVGDTGALANRLQFWLADEQRLQAAGQAARTLAEEQLTLAEFQTQIRTEIENII